MYLDIELKCGCTCRFYTKTYHRMFNLIDIRMDQGMTLLSGEYRCIQHFPNLVKPEKPNG